MKLRVLFFASLKEHLGTSEVQLDLDSLPPIEALWRSLRQDRDALPEQILFAVNHRYVPADHPLKDGDVIAFFPPVTGG